MRLLFSLVVVGIFLSFLPAYEADASMSKWELDLENGYISTKPLVVEENVIVRTSGFWTGEDRPSVYSFNLHTGQENWRYTSQNSTHHDMSPLIFVPSGQGDCGNWSDMLIVGWTDGLVTALDYNSGGLIWSSKTEVITWGITGSMALDGDEIVVPTRRGLSVFCLSDGSEQLRVDLPQLGWRNGVTVTETYYLLGNEEGVLNIVTKDGGVTNISYNQGKIRHSPIPTPYGVLVHLQLPTSSEIYLDDILLSQEGSSPAIPLQIDNDIYLATSSHVIHINCDENCSIVGRSDFYSNGEIVGQETSDGTHKIWFPRNTQEGGWGTGVPGDIIEIYNTTHDTYTTAGPGFGNNGEIVLGNDNGVLMVHNIPESVQSLEPVVVEEKEITSENSINPIHIFVVILIIVTGISQIRKNYQMANKFGLLLLLVIGISVLPELSTKWSTQLQELGDSEEDWDEDWPDEWRGTQIFVIEMPGGERSIGGLEGYTNVEDLTDAATSQLGIVVEKESYDFGDWITSFDGHTGNGWEFTVDGKRSTVGMTYAEIEEDSVIRWSSA